MEKTLVAVYAKLGNPLSIEIYKKLKREAETAMKETIFVCYNALNDFADDNMVVIKLYPSGHVYQLTSAEATLALVEHLKNNQLENSFATAEACSIMQKYHGDSLNHILLHNIESTHTNICGKCCPCRLGGPRISSFLQASLNGGLNQDDLSMLYKVGYAMKKASMCAVGLFGADPLLFAMQNFKDQLAEGAK